jgi:hypothetical protein
VHENAEQHDEHPHRARVHAVGEPHRHGEQGERDALGIDLAEERESDPGLRGARVTATIELAAPPVYEGAHFGLGLALHEPGHVPLTHDERRHADRARPQAVHGVDEAPAARRVAARLDAHDAQLWALALERVDERLRLFAVRAPDPPKEHELEGRARRASPGVRRGRRAERLVRAQAGRGVGARGHLCARAPLPVDDA